MKLLIVIAVLALTAGYVSAECNNMCSGHGQCGANDACTCYRNWRGNDCSERTCQFGVAFIDTPVGDLNHNGVINTATQVKTQWSPDSSGGVFEGITTFTSESAHAYMECSNKGLCDRAAGECVCFDGYEGSACQRTVCPNSCSGHGVCRNIVDKSMALAAGRNMYNLWDGLKNQACVCDPGYQGVDCRERMCPKGADPLVDEDVSYNAVVNNVQTITITSGATETINAGTFKLKYTDLFGEEWTTNAITAINCANSANDVSPVKDALEALPNNVISGLTMPHSATSQTNGGCEYTITFTNNPGVLNALEVVEYSTITFTNSAVLSVVVDGTATAATTVAAECSNRGLCDYETGICKCFRGYRLANCNSQHMLAYGAGAV